MSAFRITIGHLYPEYMDLYGDGGNVLALHRRAGWHGLAPDLIRIRWGERIDFTDLDLLLMGGLQRSGQERVATALIDQLAALTSAVKRGLVILAVGRSYHLLGRHYSLEPPKISPGLGILDLHTDYTPHRLVGNAVISCSLWDPPQNLVGFENHAGRTYLGPGAKPLGTVIRGYGNNGRDGTEGAVYKNVMGAHLHGPLLPKNPWLTDYLLAKAVQHRSQIFKPAPLDDRFEFEAHREATRPPRRR